MLIPEAVRWHGAVGKWDGICCDSGCAPCWGPKGMILRAALAQGFGNHVPLQAPGGTEQPETDLSWSKVLQPGRIPARMTVRPAGALSALEPKTYRNSCGGGEDLKISFLSFCFSLF